MRFVPHPYQEYAIEFIEEHPAAALLLDMGLGKTVITLTAIQSLMHDSFSVQKVLVIAPLRVARDTWPAELKKWDHLQDLTCSVAVGPAAARRAALREKADIYIINRENVPWLIQDSDTPFDYDMVVIDELSSFKSWTSKRFKTLKKVRPKIKRIVGLTGTPTGNGLMDLFAEFRLIDGGERLGRFIGQYRDAYFVPDRRNGQVVYSYKPRPGAEDLIYRKIEDITISMKSVDWLEMPELLSREYPVNLSEKERETYKTLQKDLVLQLPAGGITIANAAALSGKLCQMANGAVYGDDGEILKLHDHKLDALEDLIESMNGQPLLVAYWYKHDLARIQARLDSLGIRYACISDPDSIAAWNRRDLEVGLIHPAAAGHGLNLQAGGSTIVWYGLTWSLELYQQTNARLWRQGQTEKTVVVQHIITRGTIDEAVLRSLQLKNTTQEALIDAVRAELKGVGD